MFYFFSKKADSDGGTFSTLVPLLLGLLVLVVTVFFLYNRFVEQGQVTDQLTNNNLDKSVCFKYSEKINACYNCFDSYEKNKEKRDECLKSLDST